MVALADVLSSSGFWAGAVGEPLADYDGRTSADRAARLHAAERSEPYGAEIGAGVSRDRRINTRGT